ncbi:hypothetical protein EYF80_050142 [Liparis tanakae]|uniref:Uncharacterized protein n=1 Tax=Liparis tanakae TaxID=230148 RepID=A0A4Z2FEX0_9TELE|nr:hypothetical protein EYF80_050142 [Liparis tanakae]
MLRPATTTCAASRHTLMALAGASRWQNIVLELLAPLLWAAATRDIFSMFLRQQGPHSSTNTRPTADHGAAFQHDFRINHELTSRVSWSFLGVAPGSESRAVNTTGTYQEELPALICSRPDRHVTRPELVKLMEWKLTRGSFRPRLQQLVASNSAAAVESCSGTAFRLLPDVPAAVAELSSLKGVGPATAVVLALGWRRGLAAVQLVETPTRATVRSVAAVLAAGAPERAAFMSDEAVASVPGLEPIRYTAKHYALYLGEMLQRSEKLNAADPQQDWTPHRLERCLWASATANQQRLPPKEVAVKEKRPEAAEQRPTKKLRTR